MLKYLKNPLVIVLSVLFFDQLIKVIIKTSFMLGEEIHVAGDWFILHFTENNGMAFGMELGGETGKLILSLFRVIAISGLGYYLYTIVKKKELTGYIICIALIFAGAMGNLIDSMFYGILFDNSYGQVASFLPADGGYASLLHGKVVDMFYFPIIQGHFPTWFPIWGGEDFEFFRPVFNLADMSISFGVGFLILNQKKYFAEKPEEKKEVSSIENATQK